MAFEPLETDEKLTAKPAKTKDMDAAMLFGCTGFVSTSILGYLLSAWPFLVFPHLEHLQNLATSTALGLIPATLLGIAATRKFAVAGACGFVGAALATGIFLYLRLDQPFLAADTLQAHSPDYPRVLVTVIPIAWILVAAILALASLPKED